jgi:hypothetical protein
MASNSSNMEAILNEVTLLRKRVEELMAQAPMGSAAKKAPKAKDPEAPKKAPNSWILFTGRVRAVLKENALPAGKEAQQYASYLKTAYPEAYEMDPEAILSHHDEWTPPEPKPKEVKDEEAKPKAKRVLTEEHKAKMAAGRKAAAERRKAEAAAKAVEEASAALGGDEEDEEDEEEEAEMVEVAVKAVPKPSKDLMPLPFKGKKLLWDKETGGCWENKEGKKGKWMGVLEGTGKDRKLNGEVPEPEED